MEGSVIVEKIEEPTVQDDHILPKDVKAKRPRPNLAVGVEKLKISDQ